MTIIWSPFDTSLLKEATTVVAETSGRDSYKDDRDLTARAVIILAYRQPRILRLFDKHRDYFLVNLLKWIMNIDLKEKK